MDVFRAGFVIVWYISKSEVPRMNIWITILLLTAAAVFGLDFLIRRKKWKDNTPEEKASLLVSMPGGSAAF